MVEVFSEVVPLKILDGSFKDIKDIQMETWAMLHGLYYPSILYRFKVIWYVTLYRVNGQKIWFLPGGGFGTSIIWFASNAAISFESSGTQ